MVRILLNYIYFIYGLKWNGGSGGYGGGFHIVYGNEK
jgi:hypothetical protein